MTADLSFADAAATHPNFERFFSLLVESLAQQQLLRVLLSKHHGEPFDLERATVRALDVRGEPSLSFLYRHATRDITKNWPMAQGLAQLRELLSRGEFRTAHLFTATQEIQLSISKKGQCRLHVAAHESAVEAQTPSAAHDRAKQRLLDLDRPFLVELGVTTTQHQLIPAMSRKWKQINKFIEVFSHALLTSPLADARRIEVIDFGSGKGYLTFAIHDWLRQAKGVDAQVTGVELRADMVRLCNDAIGKLGIKGLRIEQGDVRTYTPTGLNVMIALHACDTATDHAIHLGIRAGADIIMCSPCCHKQIRPQLLSPHPLRPILQHGVHLGQEAEMVTDGLRALLLDASGYDTQVFEFISLEHTNKNKMILAVKRNSPSPQAADQVLAQIAEIKAFYGIREHCLESLLQTDRVTNPNSKLVTI